MTFKLSQDQATALKYLFDKVIIPEKPEDIAESLVKDLMVQVFKKLRDKLECTTKKNGYSLTLNDTQAKAFYVYFQNRSLPHGWKYEEVMIRAQLAELDRMYA